MTALCTAWLALILLGQASTDATAARQRALDLLLANKPTEAIAVLDAVVKANPEMADLRLDLADAHTAAADAIPPGPNRQAAQRHLLAADAQYRRAQALSPAAAELVSLRLLTLYDRDHLNRPQEAERIVRAILVTRSGTPMYHVLLARTLVDQQRLAEAATVLNEARTSVDADGKMFLAMTTANLVLETPNMALADQRRLLQGVVTLADEIIARNSDDLRDALQAKSGALLLQAERTATSDADRAALKARGDATFDQFYALAPKAPSGPSAVDENEAAIAKAVGDIASHMEAGRKPDADKALATATAAHGAHPLFWTHLAQTYTRRGDLSAALGALQQGAEADPKNPEAHHIVATYHWDIAYRDKSLTDAAKRGHITAGLAAEDKALTLNPDYMEAVVYKGILLGMQAAMETDPARKKALQAQADAAKQRGAALLKQRQ
jgi:predicted Zn-dependent protease